MLVHVNDHDDSRVVPGRGEERREGEEFCRRHEVKHFQKSFQKHCSHSVIRASAASCDFFFFFWLTPSVHYQRDEINVEQLRSFKGSGFFFGFFFYILFRYYWSQICCVIDVQYKQQQL